MPENGVFWRNVGPRINPFPVGRDPASKLPRPPGYIFFLGAVYAFTGANPQAGRVVNNTALSSFRDRN